MKRLHSIAAPTHSLRGVSWIPLLGVTVAGSATMNNTILVDRMAQKADSIRDNLHEKFGVRAFDVKLVTRTWDGGGIGLGSSTDAAVTLDPKPMVESWNGQKWVPFQFGLVNEGKIRITEVSLTYTYEELTKETAVGSASCLAANQEFFWQIEGAHGQLFPAVAYMLDGRPYPDRIETIGWVVILKARA